MGDKITAQPSTASTVRAGYVTIYFYATSEKINEE
jgi:hypothetical protein